MRMWMVGFALETVGEADLTKKDGEKNLLIASAPDKRLLRRILRPQVRVIE